MKADKKRIRRIAIFTLLFILLFLVASFFIDPYGFRDAKLTDLDSASSSNASASLTALLADSTKRALDSIALSKEMQSRNKMNGAQSDTRKSYDKATGNSSSDSANDSKKRAPESITDISPPVLSAEPGPGMYNSPIRAVLKSSEKGIIQVRINKSEEWQKYSEPFSVTDELEIFARAFDEEGNVSETIHRAWKIKKEPFPCPEGMAAVDGKGIRICMDRFEWPNKKGAIPASFVNWYAAGDSCRQLEKRLCTSSEWELACGGTDSDNYPYGDSYETRTCVTEEERAYESGKREECRSPFGIHDLSGNLREWTSTISEKNSNHYKVYGGFWGNSASSRCNTTQYSFFPENKFTHIGFRCCKDIK
ncbi:MAG: SUMF1/EgtB/PvdO family nonheme iron enzyme [Fibrobacteres bacterium]|nr:SUMF1/EgtB/PvdO family nonheme iron enzyme [Fibrobacterota bacterium]